MRTRLPYGPLLYWHRRCNTYSRTADQAVYDGTPASMAALPVGRGGHVREVASEPIGFGSSPDVKPSRATAGPPSARARVLPNLCRGECRPAAVVFMHERVGRAGVRRLVVMRANAAGDDVIWDERLPTTRPADPG